jgi:hypothetical protein
MYKNYRTLFGVVLIFAGILLFAQQAGYIGGQWDDALLTLVFGAGTIYFASFYFNDKNKWWPALVAFLLFGVTAANLLEIFLPNVGGGYAGPLLLFTFGIGFLSVFAINRQNWWAIIPGGALLSLTGVTLIDEFGGNLPIEAAGVLFIGLALTFLVLYFLPVEGQKLKWAIFPALSLLVFGLFVGFGEEDLWNLIWPAMIVILGIYFIFGAVRKT